MGAAFLMKCNKCGYSISTSGPWEFYRNWRGKRKPYGHPGPISWWAGRRGIYGLSEELYCRYCDETFDVIVSEFKKPIKDGSSPWGDEHELKDEFKNGWKEVCPKCGRDMIMGLGEGEQLACPRCKEGKLIGKMKWIS